MNWNHFKVLGRQILGWTLLVLGVAGLFLPILQGWLFIALGCLLLMQDVRFFRKIFYWVEKKFPFLRKTLRKWRKKFSPKRNRENKILVLLFLVLSQPLVAQESIKPIPPVRLVKVAEGFQSPVYVTSARDGSNRLYVVEQEGMIRVLAPGETGRGKIFLDIRDRVSSGGEMGLLSVAFHPKFRENGRFFVNYTGRKGKLRSFVSEFRYTGASPVDSKQERILLSFEQPYENHNGGLNLFGSDGFLYIGTGDGGSGNDPHNNGQRLDTLLGKILRIDVDAANPSQGYAIPKDNPFLNTSGARPEIYAFGLRNPWRFSFDNVTGKLWVGDVGQDNREEIDIVEKGKNYGWRVMEGAICTPGIDSSCDRTPFVGPILDYGRREGGSVTGGYVYRGKKFPQLQGIYFYGDFVSGNLWGLREEAGKILQNLLLLKTGKNLASFGEDELGEIYVVDYNGVIYRIEAS